MTNKSIPEHKVAPQRPLPLNKATVARASRLLHFMLPYRGLFSAGIVMLLLSSLAFMAFPLLAGKLLDAATHNQVHLPNGHLLTINELGAALLGVILLQGLFSFGRVFFISRVSVFAVRDLRQALYRKLLHLPLAYFDANRVGASMSRLTADVGMVQETFSLTVSELLRQSLNLLAGTVLVILASGKLALFMVATFPALFFIASIFGRSLRRTAATTQDELAKTNVIVEETLHAISTVKAFTNELFEVRRYNTALGGVISAALNSSLARGMFASFLIVGIFGGLILVLWRGAHLVYSGELSAGQLVAFIIYASLIGSSAGGLAELYGKLQSTLGASTRLLSILDEQEEAVHQPQSAEALQPAQASELRVDGLNFAYPTRPGVPVLQDISFSVGTGEKIALVGSSGAGKSTITQLLLQLYNHEAGTIRLNGRSLCDYDLTTLRRHIGIVPQEPMLFGGSIRDNIAYGRPDASAADIEQAARKAHAWPFIEQLPEGLDTLVGDRGVKLSGGQRQRIAIARAILKDPAILLLDEATSALDSESEYHVQAAMEELMRERTSLIIAHRLSTIRSADKILVLDGGRVTEQGTHEQLLLTGNGAYANLLRLQLEAA
jgi:ABC-type multidrug transport system fused ATPase/permease subunit